MKKRSSGKMDCTKKQRKILCKPALIIALVIISSPTIFGNIHGDVKVANGTPKTITRDTVQESMLHIFTEGYYSRSLSSSSRYLPDYYFNHKKLQSPGINFTSIQYQFNRKKWGFQIGIQDGRYVANNYSQQPLLNQLLSQANISIQPLHSPCFKILAGIFPSHIGFESAWNTDNLTLTRSMLAENSPYYESGMQFIYTHPNNIFEVKGLWLSGWQQSQWKIPIQRPSFGWGSFLKIKNWGKISYNGFVGFYDNLSTESYQYHNVFLQLQKEQWEMIAGFDFGIKDHSHSWYSPVIILSRTWSEKLKSALRFEQMTDPNQVILLDPILSIRSNQSISFNLDWKINPKFTFRSEYKLAVQPSERSHSSDQWITFNLIFQRKWQFYRVKLDY
jgi:hypothetical protein